jgi:hypothetical protein
MKGSVPCSSRLYLRVPHRKGLCGSDWSLFL